MKKTKNIMKKIENNEKESKYNSPFRVSVSDESDLGADICDIFISGRMPIDAKPILFIHLKIRYGMFI